MSDRQNITVEVDAGCVNFRWTDATPGEGVTAAVFATLGEAKAWAVEQAVPERDQWSMAVRDARNATLRDVL